MISKRVILLMAFAAPLAALEPLEPPAASSAPVRAIDLFWSEAGRRTGLPAESLDRWAVRGFGRTELLILAAVARRSPQTLDALVAARERGASLRALLRALAEKEGLTYNPLFRDAMRQRQDIENAVAASSPPVSGARVK